MAASLPTGVLPAHPGELTTSEKPKLTPMSTEEEPSEAAELGGSHNLDHSQLPHDKIRKSSQELSPVLRFSPQDQVGLCDQQSPRRGLVSDLDMVHPESACDEGDVCEVCGRSTSDGRRVLKLEKDVKRLEEALQEKDQIIATLCEENSRKTAELLEIQLQKVRQKSFLIYQGKGKT